MKILYHIGCLKNDQNSKRPNQYEEAKSEGYGSDEEDFQEIILRAIEEEDDDSDVSSLPSQIDEQSVVAIIKYNNVHTN